MKISITSMVKPLWTDRRRGLAAVAAVAALAVAGCETAPPAPRFPELSYAYLEPIKLDVARVDVVDQYTSPGQRPNVEHLFPTPPEMALRRWAADRLRPVGANGAVRFVIKRASVTEVPLKPAGGVRGALTEEPAERYDAVVEVALAIIGPDGAEQARIDTRAERSRTVLESASVNDRRRAWFEMTEAMMNDLNRELESQIAGNLGRWRRY